MQLYYIPLLAYLSFLLLPIAIVSTRQSHRIFVVGFCAIAVLVAITQQMPLTPNFPSATRLSIFATYFKTNFPYALLGIFFFYVRSVLSASTSKKSYFHTLQLATIFVVVSILWKLSGAIYTLDYLRNIVIFWACFLLKPIQTGLSQQIAKFSFGIYLSHPLFIEGFQKAETALGLSLNSFLLTAFNFAIALTLSLLTCQTLAKHRRTRFLVA